MSVVGAPTVTRACIYLPSVTVLLGRVCMYYVYIYICVCVCVCVYIYIYMNSFNVRMVHTAVFFFFLQLNRYGFFIDLLNTYERNLCYFFT